MRQMKRPLLTVFVIFGSAFLLAAVGCGSSSSSNRPNQSPDPVIADNQSPVEDSSPAEVITELKPSEIKRECTDAEFSKLAAWRNLLNSANGAITAAAGKKETAAIDAAVKAIRSCDVISDYHKQNPCRRTHIITGEVKLYDQSRLLKDCKSAETYLVKNNARPAKGGGTVVQPTPQPQPQQPSQPSQPPAVDEPVVISPDAPASEVGPFKQCSSDEFTKLSQMSAVETKANAAIKALGSMLAWKYDSNAISSAALLVKACEPLIQYHAANPCEKSVKQTDGSVVKKEYTQSTLRNRCQLARTYFYEFVQNTKTLNFKNADLFIDMTPFPEKSFLNGYYKEAFGQCIIENRTGQDISYGNQLVLLKDSRASIDNKMIVFETNEGLLIQCYGLSVEGPFSKREVEKIMSSKATPIKLVYKLK